MPYVIETWDKPDSLDLRVSVRPLHIEFLKANTGKLEIETWAPHMRLQTDKKFRSDPNIWYTLKCKVDIKDGAAHIFGKVWKRDEAEPAEWTIEAIDPHANETGSPAIYVYTLADCLIDNVVISQE